MAVATVDRKKSEFGERYGWKPSLPDFRDKVADVSGLTIKDEVDPRGVMQPCYDQGKLGSCTANAVAGAIEYNRILDKWDATGTPSRLFLYYCERKIEGSLANGDTGAYGRDGFKAATNYGVLPETDFPYDITKYQTAPTTAQWTEAKDYVLENRYAVVAPTKATIKAILSNNQTVAFGFTVYESFEKTLTLSSGLVPMPMPTERQLGGHETLVVGYLKNFPDYALVRNSWGQDIYKGLQGAGTYGGGYFLMPWTYICSSTLAGDWRTIVRAVAHAA